MIGLMLRSNETFSMLDIIPITPDRLTPYPRSIIDNYEDHITSNPSAVVSAVIWHFFVAVHIN